MSAKLIVVTVNYCSADAILEGLDETVAQLRALGDAVFWIVDNASPDTSFDVLQQAISERAYGDIVELIAAPSNGGFGAGNNVAIHRAQSLDVPPEYLYFLNPDAVPTPGAIQELVSFMRSHPIAGISGSLLVNEGGDVEASFFQFPSFASEIETAVSLGVLRRLLKRHVVVLGTPDVPEKVDWVSGASFIARLDALKQSGPFDETFFLYWEEVELCHRIHKAGFDIYAVPHAVVQHIGGVTTGVDNTQKRTPVYWFQSRNHFFRATGVAGPVGVLNVAVVCGLVLQRMHKAVRLRPIRPPHYLKDFMRHSFRRNA